MGRKKKYPPHEVGEFFVKGLTLCDGYYNNQAATNEAFQDGWLGLGDLGTQDEEGFYYIVDRKQDMILSGAINVYPAEIEEVLYKHPQIADVAVIGIPHEKLGKCRWQSSFSVKVRRWKLLIFDRFVRGN